MNKKDISEVEEYFEDYGTPLTDNFSLEDFAEEVGLDEEDAEVFLVNMDNEEVMNQIANGIYHNFSVLDQHLFNDSYGDVLSMFLEKKH